MLPKNAILLAAMFSPQAETSESACKEKDYTSPPFLGGKADTFMQHAEGSVNTACGYCRRPLPHDGGVVGTEAEASDTLFIVERNVYSCSHIKIKREK